MSFESASVQRDRTETVRGKAQGRAFRSAAAGLLAGPLLQKANEQTNNAHIKQRPGKDHCSRIRGFSIF